MADESDLATRLREALGRGDVSEVEALVAAGADLHARDQHGYGAALHAVYSRDLAHDANLLDLLGWLVARGVDVDAASRHGETPIRRLAWTGRFDAVRLLLEGGADPSPLGWSPLHRAVALGSPADLRTMLAAGADTEVRDGRGCTALLLAALGGNEAAVETLLQAGAAPAATDSAGDGAVALAVEGGHPSMVRHLLERGFDADLTNAFGTSPIETAAQWGRADCAELLLAAGVDVASKEGILSVPEDGPTVRLLLAAGADPADLTHVGRRAAIGFGPPDPRALDHVTAEAFETGRERVFGAANPERIAIPFQSAMIRAGVSAADARSRFGVDFCGDRPVWTADRFGQSLTLLADGRAIMVGGEHEDWYDDDFCIFNDVIVVEPGGGILHLGYPADVFPPTDFHTATPVGGRLWIVGSLGYPRFRTPGSTPVHVLDLDTYAIEPVAIEGPSPGWIFKHRAVPVGTTAIRISGGEVVTTGDDGRDRIDPNASAWILDTSARRWLPQ